MAYIINGEVIAGESLELSLNNRALNYGDGVFESIKYSFNRLNFWEDHYFRLMASMRLLRMEIPKYFSPEYLEKQLLACAGANGLLDGAARVKLLVYRKAGGRYTPVTNDVDFIVTAEPLENAAYQLNEVGLNIDLYKDFFIQPGMLSNLKLIGSGIYTIASVFRTENKYDECVLLNDRKEVVEAISSNLFILKGKEVYTAPLSSGCLKGVMRKQVIDLLPRLGYEVKEETFSPFELQRADEIFLTNSIKGVQWVSNYRKKEFGKECASALVKQLNVKVAIG